jgi:hypothetical protein
MSHNERSQGLAIERPISYSGKSQDERQERMRQLANVVIDIFVAQRSQESYLAGAA